VPAAKRTSKCAKRPYLKVRVYSNPPTKLGKSEADLARDLKFNPSQCEILEFAVAFDLNDDRIAGFEIVDQPCNWEIDCSGCDRLRE